MNRPNLRLFRGVVCLSIIGGALAGCAKWNDPITQAERKDSLKPGPEEIKATAEEAFIYGLPIVMNYAVMYSFCVDKTSSQYKGPFNTIANEARVFTYKDTAIITPNSDTPYSMLWLDLRAEPMVISVPAVDQKRYYSVMLNDGNTFNYGYIGSRATGNAAGDYLIAGPSWNGDVPAGIKKVFHSTTQFSLAAFRTQLFNAADTPNVVRVQRGYKVQPLSSFLKTPPPPPAPAIAFPKISEEMVKDNFFHYLDFALTFAPAGPEEADIRRKLARIGIGPDKQFDFNELSLAHRAELLMGMKAGEDKVEQKVTSIGHSVNGWRIAAAFGDRDFYHGDWLLRAAAAKAGIYGNDAAEATYPMTKSDGDGKPLDGSLHKYTITFPAGGFPPVNAFWSITMYDGKTQLLIKNPIDRYLINSPMLPDLIKNKDGSLTLYVQKDAPGGTKRANWLPAPNGPIYMVMRLYWPKTGSPSVLPPGAGDWQPPKVVVAE